MDEAKAQPLRYQVFVMGPNDLLRTSAGAARLFTSLEEAQRVATEEGGFVQPAGQSSPGGFDRPF